MHIILYFCSQQEMHVGGFTCSTTGLFASSSKSSTDLYVTEVSLTHLYQSHQIMSYLYGILCSIDRANFPLTSAMFYPDIGAPVSEKLAGFTSISIWGPDLILRFESGHLELLNQAKLQQEIDGIGGILGKSTTTYPSILVMQSGGFQWVSFSSASYLVGWSPQMEFLNTFCAEISQWKTRTGALIGTLDSIRPGVKDMSLPLNTTGIAYETVLKDVNTIFQGEILEKPIDSVLEDQMKILSKDSSNSIRRALTLSLLRNKFEAIQMGLEHVYQYGIKLLNHYSLFGDLVQFGPSKKEKTLMIQISSNLKTAKLTQQRLGSSQRYIEFLSCSIESMSTSLYSYQRFERRGTDIIFDNKFLAPTSLNLFTNSSVISKYSKKLSAINLFQGILYLFKNYDNNICHFCIKNVRLKFFYGDETVKESQCYDAIFCALSPMIVNLEGRNYSLHSIQMSLLHSLQLKENITALTDKIEVFLQEHSVSLTLGSTLLLILLSIFSFILLLCNRCCSQCSGLSHFFIRPIVRRHINTSIRLSEL